MLPHTLMAALTVLFYHGNMFKTVRHPIKAQVSLWDAQLQGRLDACGDPWSKELWLVWAFIARIFPISSKLKTALNGHFLVPAFSQVFHLSCLCCKPVNPSQLYLWHLKFIHSVARNVQVPLLYWSCVLSSAETFRQTPAPFLILQHTQCLWSTHCKKYLFFFEGTRIHKCFLLCPSFCLTTLQMFQILWFTHSQVMLLFLHSRKERDFENGHVTVP